MTGLMSWVCHPALKALSPATLFYTEFAWSGHDRRRMEARSVRCTSRSQGEVIRMGAILPPLDTRLLTSLQVHRSGQSLQQGTDLLHIQAYTPSLSAFVPGSCDPPSCLGLPVESRTPWEFFFHYCECVRLYLMCRNLKTTNGIHCSKINALCIVCTSFVERQMLKQSISQYS